ncbi:MAG: putative dehydrogenase [Algoriphagus sp.]|jgi:predicted dehydrogenase
MSKKITFIQRRNFIKKTGLGLFGLTLAPAVFANIKAGGRLRTAHIGVGNMGMEDLKAISSHALVDVTALCDVDVNNLAAAAKLHPKAKTYSDYRTMLKEMEDEIDAVIVSTPDHTHAPASMMAMKMEKPVYCQKPLTHYVIEARKMKALAKKNNLVTQMGIQVHSFYDYKLATLLIQSGIIGKVHTVRAWSPKNWGYDGPEPIGSDPIPETLDWNLWLGTSAERPYKANVYHPANWRQLVDYGCGTLGDMGVHIFDTPYNALALDVPRTIVNECREPNGFGFPVNNTVTYEFPETPYTAESLKWVWYDGPGAPPKHEDLMLPNGEELPDQGAMFIGEKGRLLLPHFQQLPRKIVGGKYVEMDIESFNLGKPVKDYASESKKHYHQFVDACLGNGKTTAPFDYSAKLTETILLGVIAGRFPNETLNWDSKKGKFAERKANKFLNGKYRKF